jgi:hypothetical protein
MEPAHFFINHIYTVIPLPGAMDPVSEGIFLTGVRPGDPHRVPWSVTALYLHSTAKKIQEVTLSEWRPAFFGTVILVLVLALALVGVGLYCIVLYCIVLYWLVLACLGLAWKWRPAFFDTVILVLVLALALALAWSWPWLGLAWFGLAWLGLAWLGLAWFGLILILFLILFLILACIGFRQWCWLGAASLVVSATFLFSWLDASNLILLLLRLSLL